MTEQLHEQKFRGMMTQCKAVIVHPRTGEESGLKALILCHTGNHGSIGQYSGNQQFLERVLFFKGHFCILSKAAVLNYNHAFLFRNSS